MPLVRPPAWRRIARIAPYFILFVSGLGKLLSPETSAMASVQLLGLDYLTAYRLTIGLASFEIAIALLAVAKGFRDIAALACVFIGIGFAAGFTLSLVGGGAADCGCFGDLLRFGGHFTHASVIAVVLLGAALDVQQQFRGVGQASEKEPSLR